MPAPTRKSIPEAINSFFEFSGLDLILQSPTINIIIVVIQYRATVRSNKNMNISFIIRNLEGL